jgi:hypothetical protein
MTPQFEYFLETVGQPVTPQHPLWLRPLPVSRQALSGSSSSCSVPDECITVQDYFQAVRAFLEGAGKDAIARSLTGWGADASAVRLLRIFLAKHGACYHPARLETEIDGTPFRWVVNVALSDPGKTILFKECALLERLRREFTVSYVPEIYGASEVDAGRGRVLTMFLAQWFSGFHEFHLTRDTPGAQPALVLWDPESGARRLDRAQARAIYYQVARILTHYLKLPSFEGISAWHHAAGDFVVRLKEDQPEVRLITVREYRPLFKTRQEPAEPAHGIEALLESLLIFLLNLGVRTRLDRLDGTGELAWSDPVAVEATVAGVLDGLADQPAPFELPLALDQLFRPFLGTCGADDLLALCTAIAAKNYPLGSPERALLGARLEEHARTLAKVLSKF